MSNFSVINTIKALTILELPDDTELTQNMVNKNFRKLCLIYHPDQANERYKDGEKFYQLTEAKEYLIENLPAVNYQIRNGFREKSTFNNDEEKRRREEQAYRRKQQEEEELRKAENARRAEEERRAEAKRMAEEDHKEKMRKATLRNNRITAAIVLTLILASPFIYALFGFNSSKNTSSAKQSVSSETSAAPQKNYVSYDNSTVPTIKITNSVIYNGNGVTITAKGIEKVSNGWKVKLLIDNHSALNLGFNAHAYAVNGIMTRNNIYDMDCDVAAGKEANTYILLKNSVLETYGIKEIRCIDVLFWAYDNDKYFKEFDTNQIEIKTELYDGKHDMFQKKSIFDENGIRVDYIGRKGDKFYYCITNTTGTYFDFDLSEITINNYTRSEIDYDLFDEMVLNDCQIAIVIEVSNNFKTENSIDTIRRIEWNMKVRPKGEYSDEYKIGPILYEVE